MVFWRCWFRIQTFENAGVNLGPKIQSCPFCLKIGAHSVLRMLIPNPDLDFWNFDPENHFCANLGPKTQSCQFCLKIGTHGISRMLILIPTLVFWISNLISFFSKFGPKKSKLSVVTGNWRKWYLKDAYSYSNIFFMNSQL